MLLVKLKNVLKYSINIIEARNIWPEYIPHDVTKLAEFEFYLIEEMDLYLLLHHPYKSLMQINEFYLIIIMYLVLN